MIKRIIAWIKDLFSFETNDKDLSIDEKIAALSSTSRMAEVTKAAYQELQRQGCFTGIAPDGNEIEIRAECMQLDLLLTNIYYNKISKYLSNIKALGNKLSEDVSVKVIGLSPMAAEAEIRAISAQKKPLLDSFYNHLKDAEHNLQIFKGANGINRAPEFPDSDKAVIIFIFISIVFEAIANMFFLRQGTSTPTALLIAILAAALNITISAYFGTIYRWVNHSKPTKRIKGYLSIAIAFFFVIFLNSFVAWARLKIASESNLNIINTSFMVESFFLYLVGISLGCFAFIKGYRLDDIYPGYGAVYRTWLHADEDFKNAESQLREQTLNVVEKMDKTIEAEKDSINYADTQINELVENSRRDLNEWSGYREVLNNALQGLVSAYRSIAEAHLVNRRLSVPAYFSTPACLDNNKLLGEARQHNDNIEDNKDQREKDKMKNLDLLSAARTKLMDWRANSLHDLINSYIPRS